MNIVEPILFQAKHCPPAPAMCAPGAGLGLVSYARLAQFIHNVGRRAIALGIAPGHTVAIQVNDRILHATLALGLMHIGVATVSIGAGPPPGLLLDAIATDQPRAFANGTPAQIIAADPSWIAGDGSPIDERHVYRGSGDDVCRISVTSGSTGEAKAIGLTHNVQFARLARYVHVFGNMFPNCSRFFSDFGLGSSGGFRHMLYALSRGGLMVFPGATPMDTLQAFDLYKVQALMASPGGLAGFLKFYEANRNFPCSFEIVLSAGSPLHDSLSERVRARMCSNLVFYYGTSETATVSSAPAHALAGMPGAVGYPMPDVSIAIVDENDVPLPPGGEGSVRVKSPVGVGAYWHDAPQSDAAFREGYFCTGDIGFITKDRLLVITGREKDVLNLGGDKVKPQIIEEVISAFGGVGEAAAFSRPNDLGIEQIWALVVPKNGALDEGALRRHCRERLPDIHVPVGFIAVATLPRNDNGKIERRSLSAMAEHVVPALQ